MSVRYGLLALLAEAPAHGYQLKTAFERRTGGSWAHQHRAGLHDPPAPRARRAREVRRARPTGTGRLPDHRSRRAKLANVVRDAGRRRGPARDELTIKVLLAVAAGDVDVTTAPAPATRVGRAAPGVHPPQGTGRPAAGHRLPDPARRPDLPDRGRDPLARRLRGPHPESGDRTEGGRR